MCTDRHSEIKQFMQLLERPEKKFGLQWDSNKSSFFMLQKVYKANSNHRMTKTLLKPW